MPATPGVFVELLNLPEDSSQEWSSWYDETYLKARTRVPGVVSARRARGLIGSIQNIVVYDLDNFYTPYTPEWTEADHAVEAEHPAPPALAEALAGVDALAYRQIFSMDEGDYTPEETEILHGAFFEVESRDQDELNDWYNTEHVEFVKTVEGYLNCRRFQALERPTKFLALYDVVRIENSEAKDVAPPNHSPWAVRVRSKLPTFRERRLFRVERREAGQGRPPR
jgi:hypothetical protein